MYPDECAQTSTGIIIVTPTGEFFMAIAFLVLAVCTAIFLLMGLRHQREKRSFFLITAFITLVSSVSYFGMLAGQGWSIAPNCRQMFYSRFISFAATTALIIVDLALIAGVEMTELWATLGTNFASVFCLWMASVSQGNVKWMWFLYSVGMLVPIYYVVYRHWSQLAHLHHVSVSELYNKVSLLVLVTWGVYPMVWLIGTGGNIMSPNFELMCYAALDILTQAVFGFLLLMSHEALDRCTNVHGYRHLSANIAATPSYFTDQQQQQQQLNRTTPLANNPQTTTSSTGASPTRSSTVVMT